jgi:lysophospholipase L1-like esterase
VLRTSRIARALVGVASAALAAAALTGAASPAASSAHHPRPDRHHAPDYYVSLGDSLAAGYQPNVGGDTNESYTDQLYAQLKKRDPNLVHIKLGCSGETTQTMISGGICSYPGATSQLDAAVKFLDAHRGRVRYVTLDIGANDVDGCATATGLNLVCAEQGITTVSKQLPQIAEAVRRAGGRRPQYVGMNYYDPFLAAWLTGAAGQQLAEQSVTLSTGFNSAVQAGLRASGFKLADVSKTFATDDFSQTVTVPGIGTLPVNVARVCEWTWECTPYHNIHANTLGYGVIAGVFERVLERRR